MNFQITKQKKRRLFTTLILFLLSLFVCSVYAQTKGDVNTDGAINIVDALMVSQYYVGLSVPNFNAASADVDSNGRVEIIDALMIAQYYVGLITSFPGGPTRTPTPGPTGTGAPKAAFTISNITPALNQAVTFNASGSSDPGGSITGYQWDFGDSSTGSGVQVSHTFTTVDDFKVVLTVTDNSGLTGKNTQRVFIGRPQGWTEVTHHKSADANYDLLFPVTSVPRIDIAISASDFQRMETDLNTLNIMSTVDPIYVPATVKFNGYTWWNVGMRYKGQSTLFLPRQAGKKKLPFRLNFDKFEDDYPEIDNQRFYGFSEMTFANNWYDSSYVRDVVCAEIFRAGGIPAARGGFARIYIDTGSGPVYWGLYSMIEDPSDQLIKYQFADDTGNMYKPEGSGAEFSRFVQSVLVKKTNEDAADYSDMQAFITALNASRSNAATWRANLEAVFDAGSFVRWLAINTAIINFDTYGWVTKNYYLYQDFANNGRLVWIPWDFNLSLSQTNPWSVPIPSLSLSEIGTNWPLIRYLIDDPVYKNLYHQEMRTALTGCFNEATVTARIRQYHNLIRPYVVGTEPESSTYSYLTNGASEFDQALTTLLNHITSRRTTVQNYLNSL